MRLLDKLVLGTFLRLFVAGLAATPPLFVLADVTENLDRYIDRGLTTMQVAAAYLYMLPTYIQWSFPIAALIAAVFTVHNMTMHREVVAAKAGGISFHRLVLPVIGGEGLADRGFTSPWLAMWMPNLLYLAVGVFMVIRMGRESGNSRGGGWDEVLWTIRSRAERLLRRSPAT